MNNNVLKIPFHRTYVQYHHHKPSQVKQRILNTRLNCTSMKKSTLIGPDKVWTLLDRQLSIIDYSRLQSLLTLFFFIMFKTRLFCSNSNHIIGVFKNKIIIKLFLIITFIYPRKCL